MNSPSDLPAAKSSYGAKAPPARRPVRYFSGKITNNLRGFGIVTPCQIRNSCHRSVSALQRKRNGGRNSFAFVRQTLRWFTGRGDWVRCGNIRIEAVRQKGHHPKGWCFFAMGDSNRGRAKRENAPAGRLSPAVRVAARECRERISPAAPEPETLDSSRASGFFHCALGGSLRPLQKYQKRAGSCICFLYVLLTPDPAL